MFELQNLSRILINSLNSTPNDEAGAIAILFRVFSEVFRKICDFTALCGGLGSKFGEKNVKKCKKVNFQPNLSQLTNNHGYERIITI
jgi:hypothetical protein